MDPSDDRRAIFRDASGQDTVLVPGETLRLGRHVDNDIVINDTTASRFHATVRWDPELERPVLYDNGSANGTVVNGTEVHNATHPVGQHAVIEISGHRLDVRLENCGETPAILKNAGDMVTLFSDQGPEIKGTIGTDASIRELLQRLEAERRTGTLVLSSSGAKVTVCLGKLMQAFQGRSGASSNKTAGGAMAQAESSGLWLAALYDCWTYQIPLQELDRAVMAQRPSSSSSTPASAPCGAGESGAGGEVAAGVRACVRVCV